MATANLIDGDPTTVCRRKDRLDALLPEWPAPPKTVFDLTGDFREDIRQGDPVWTVGRQMSAGREGTCTERSSAEQQGATGDMTASLPAGLWTPAIAEKLLAQHELFWDEARVRKAHVPTYDNTSKCQRGFYPKGKSRAE